MESPFTEHKRLSNRMQLSKDEQSVPHYSNNYIKTSVEFKKDESWQVKPEQTRQSLKVERDGIVASEQQYLRSSVVQSKSAAALNSSW